VAQVRAYIDEVMDIVDLIDIQYGFVGQPGLSGLSVEQRKRLTIAVELVAK
jgi:ABC-type multidrug transport system ATPase subunit